MFMGWQRHQKEKNKKKKIKQKKSELTLSCYYISKRQAEQKTDPIQVLVGTDRQNERVIRQINSLTQYNTLYLSIFTIPGVFLLFATCLLLAHSLLGTTWCIVCCYR